MITNQGQIIQWKHWPTSKFFVGCNKDMVYKQSSDSITYVSGNNRVITHQTIFGELYSISSQEKTFKLEKPEKEREYACSWIKFETLDFSNKPLGTGGPSLWYKIKFGTPEGDKEVEYDTRDEQLDHKTTYIDLSIPVTTINTHEMEISILSFAPTNGEIRPRGVLYVIQLKNNTARTLKGKIILHCNGEFYNVYGMDWRKSDQQTAYYDSAINALVIEDKTYGACLIAGSDKDTSYQDQPQTLIEMPFSSAPGTKIEGCIMVTLGRNVEEAKIELETLREKGAFDWFRETVNYWTQMRGDLNIEDGEFFADFFTRCIYESLLCVRLNKKGEVIGGSFVFSPAGEFIWRSDAYYYTLPHQFLNPKTYGNFTTWYIANCLPPENLPMTMHTQNSVAPIIMAGFYHEATGDKDFFIKNPQIREITKYVLEKLSESHPRRRWLFPSVRVSDGKLPKPYDFGTNVRVWLAFKKAAEIMKIYGDPKATGYEEIAEKMRNDVDNFMVVKGPFGDQYIGGTDFKEILLYVDGEDSNPGLAAAYGFCEYANKYWKNLMKFAFSEHHLNYNRESGGLSWWDNPITKTCFIETTFPGFTTRLASSTTIEELLTALDLIRGQTSVNGSIWWWPPGRFVRCNWGQGIFAYIFITRILGITIDAPKKRLKFNPFFPWRSFSWRNIKLGNVGFTFQHIRENTEIRSKIVNQNPEKWEVSFGFYIPKDKEIVKILVNGETYVKKPMVKMEYECKSFSLSLSLEANAEVDVEITLE